MKNKLLFSSGIICYIFSTILICYYLVLEFSIIDLTSPLKRLKIILLVIVLMYIGSYFLNKSSIKQLSKLYKINLWIWFTLYIVMLLNLTLFDEYFGRTGIAMISNSTNQFREYLTNNFNIIPFATINNYFIALKNHNLSNSTFIYNIFGNLLAFAPFVFFIPRLFNSVDKWSKFFFVTSIFIIIIETMQMITMSGSFDIDDYILNITGANILYIIINNKYLKNYIDSFIHLEYLQ